ncbi:MAG: alanine racemase, partial [Pseudomonadota bacterium]
MSFGARAKIRLGALRHNLNILKQAVPGSRVMAVIKGNAFGHGLLPVANALSEADSL